MGGRPVSSLAVIAEGDDPELVVRARELGDQLGIPVVEREGGEFELVLAVTAVNLLLAGLALVALKRLQCRALNNRNVVARKIVRTQ